MKVLVDADAYIALYYREDALHAKATKLLKELPATAMHFVTYDVVSEVTTKLSYFLSKDAAKEFLSNLAKAHTEVILPTEDLYKKTKSKFKSVRSKRVSFTDCANIIAYKEYEIDAIFSFDKIYEKHGLNVLK